MPGVVQQQRVRRFSGSLGDRVEDIRGPGRILYDHAVAQRQSPQALVSQRPSQRGQVIVNGAEVTQHLIAAYPDQDRTRPTSVRQSVHV